MTPWPEGPEQILEGGRCTAGVVLVGETVRRPAKPSSAFMRELLRHLEAMDFAGAPRHLGQDAAGRDVLSYIPGEVPAKFRYFGDAQLADAAALLRRLHDATRGSALAGGHAVVCHHDAGPNNAVFQDGRPVAFIDFDFAAPGAPLEDLAYMGWSWCVSSRPDRGPVAIQAAQLRVLADAYGMEATDRAALPAAMIHRQAANAAYWQRALTHFEGPATSPEDIQARIDWSLREMRFTETHQAIFSAAL